ncbi:stonin-2 [Lissotriton helveticus]
MTSLAGTISTCHSEWVSFQDEEPCTGSPRAPGIGEKALERSFSSSVSSSENNPAQDEGSLENSAYMDLGSSMDQAQVGSSGTPPIMDSLKSDLPSTMSTWVQFEEAPWSSPSQSKGQTEFSFKAVDYQEVPAGSFRRHPLTSESSFTTHSQDNSSPSIGPSYTDVHSVTTEETPGRTSAAGSADNSSSFQEDDEIDMDTVNWQTNGIPVNGHATAPRSAHFSSWVTFEEDDTPSSPLRSDLSGKPESPQPSSVPDANRNFVGSFKKRERPKSMLVDFSKVQKLDLSALKKPLSPVKATNPFLDESLKDVLPSPINPFISFFEEQEKRSQTSSVTSAPGRDQRDSFYVICQELDTINFEDYNKRRSQSEALEQLKQLQIGDPDLPGSPTLPDDPIKPNEPIGPPLTFARPQPKDGWTLMLRIPEKKNIMSSRHWGPICVKLTETGFIQLFYEKGLEKPFREFKLEICHEISEPKLQNYDDSGRIHTVRIDRIFYKEKRKYQPKPMISHAAEKEQVIKLGTPDYEEFVSFINVVRDALMNLPATLDLSTVGLNYIEEEITVDVKDEFHGILAKKDNRILQHSVVTHIYVLSFLSGLAYCRLGLNDILIKGNEIVSRHDIMPTTTTRWIKLFDCQFHGSVDEEVFHGARMVVFNPLDACKFELMRFRTIFAEKTLPFAIRTAACVKGAEVELQSWLVMSTGFSSNRDPLTQVPCENVMIRYPVPTEWIKNFRRDSMLGEKSLKAKVNRQASFGSTSISGSEPAMRVTLGTAKYEHAYGSIVWRINRLPDKNSASGHPHCFFCHLELGSDREVPSSFVGHVEVEFDMPTTSASKATVRSISVEDKTDVRKWVNYSAHYNYKVEIEQKKSLDLEVDDVDNPKECAMQ